MNRFMWTELITETVTDGETMRETLLGAEVRASALALPQCVFRSVCAPVTVA